MTDAQDFLVEIGTEELPPKALRSLMDAFAANIEAALADARLAHGPVRGLPYPLASVRIGIGKLLQPQPPPFPQ